MPPKCTDAEKEWVAGAACRKPADLRLAASAWSGTLLARHAKKSAGSARLPRGLGQSRRRSSFDLVYGYFRQDNENPVSFKRSCRMDEFDPSEKVEIALAI